jgi:hypothetical protein
LFPSMKLLDDPSVGTNIEGKAQNRKGQVEIRQVGS